MLFERLQALGRLTENFQELNKKLIKSQNISGSDFSDMYCKLSSIVIHKDSNSDFNTT